MRAALHCEKGGDEKRLVADFADEDCAEALQKGVRDRRVPAAVSTTMIGKAQGNMNTALNAAVDARIHQIMKCNADTNADRKEGKASPFGWHSSSKVIQAPLANCLIGT
jgi:hypothetical protein